MLTIKAEIKRSEQKVDGTYNVKLRFTLNRRVKRLSTSLFVRPEDLTRTGAFKKASPIVNDINSLILAYQNKCNAMQIDLHNYSLEELFAMLKFEEQKSKEIDFIKFARQRIKDTTIKSKADYTTVVNSIVDFVQRDYLYISEINVSFLNRYVECLQKRRDNRIKKLIKQGKTIPSNRMQSSYMGAFRHLFKEAQRKYNDFDNQLFLIPNSPFDNIHIPRQEATRKRAIDSSLIKKIHALPYKNECKGQKRTCRYDLAKDMFILSFCLIGMNSVDIYNATEILNNSITYNRTKTKDRRLDEAKMIVNIPDLAIPIIEKYKDKTGKRLFRFYNDYSDRKAFNKAINSGLKQIGKELDIDDLEFYAARHSWATIAINKCKIDKYIVHSALNHVDASMKVTDIYIERNFVIENEANRKVLEYVFGE